MIQKWPPLVQAFGFIVGSTGGLDDSARGIANVIRNGVGDYSVEFKAKIQSPSAAARHILEVIPSYNGASPTERNPSAWVQESGDPFTVRFEIYDAAGAPIDSNFHIYLLLPG